MEVLEQLGGVATRAALIASTSRAGVDAALAAGDIAVLARGRYALPAADEAVQAAHRVTGVLVRSSAALHHGWPVLTPPDRPQIAVPRNRTLAPAQAEGIDVCRPRLGPDDVHGIATSQDRTLVDCLRGPSFPEALAVADSALRDGYSPARLRALARDLGGPGSALARRVAALADDRAANPFESALRAVGPRRPGARRRAAGVDCETGASSAGRTSSTSGSGSSWRPTPSSGTAAARRWRGMPGATTSSASTAGSCCASPGRTWSCTP